MPKKGSYHDLKVYQIAYQTSLEIHKATGDFPKTEQFGGVADQLRRASKSVCANLVEGHAKQLRSRPEFIRFIWIAMGSVDETKLWLEYARDLGYIKSASFNVLEKQYESIGAMLYRLAQSKG